MRIIDTKRYYTLEEAAQYAGVCTATLRYQAQTGAVAPASHDIPHSTKKWFDDDDLENIKKFFTDYKPNFAWQSKYVEKYGLYTQKDASRALGIPHVTLATALQDGRLPRPSHRKGVFYYYNAEDIEALKALHAAGEGRFVKNPPAKETAEALAATNEVSQRLGVSSPRIRYYLRHSPKLKGVGRHIGSNLYFTAEDEARLKEFFAGRPAKWLFGREQVLDMVEQILRSQK